MPVSRRLCQHIEFVCEGVDFWQPRRHLAHVEFAGDYVGDQAGAVFPQEFDLAVGAEDGRVDDRSGFVQMFDDCDLFGAGRQTDFVVFLSTPEIYPRNVAPVPLTWTYP